MSAKEELRKLQSVRSELEAESRSLTERLQNLAKSFLALEERIVVEELKKEKALVEDLRNRNLITRNVIAQLETRKNELEIRLGQMVQIPEATVCLLTGNEMPEKPEKANEASEKTEMVPEETEVSITVIESETVA